MFRDSLQTWTIRISRRFLGSDAVYPFTPKIYLHSQAVGLHWYMAGMKALPSIYVTEFFCLIASL
jgi:hypothetical protein